MDGTTGTPAGQAKDSVSVPAIFLIITGVIGIFTALLSFALPGMLKEVLAQMNDPNMAQARAALESSSSVGRSVLALVSSLVVIFGGVQMKNLKSYPLALTASILAMLPYVGPCCCIGLPIGIWSVVVLMKPEVKASFS